MGLFTKCKLYTKQLVWQLVQFLSHSSSDLTVWEMETFLGKKIPYWIIKKLRDAEILIKTDGDEHKMLVDGISPPAYGRQAIDAMKFSNHKALLDDAKSRPEIHDIISTIFAEYIITEWPSTLGEFIKIYNKILDMILDRKLYNESFGYWRLEWRPQKANKYVLNIEYLKMFIYTKKTALKRAIQTSIVK